MSEKVITFNHISIHLLEDDKNELISYYKTYHKKSWCYHKAFKRYKREKFLLDTSSVLFAGGGVISSAVTSGIGLVGITGVAIILQMIKKHKKLEEKIDMCKYAYQTYQHLMGQIKYYLRTGEFSRDFLINNMQQLDDIIIDLARVVKKFEEKYDQKFGQS